MLKHIKRPEEYELIYSDYDTLIGVDDDIRRLLDEFQTAIRNSKGL